MNLSAIMPKRKLDVLFEIYAEGQDYLRNISKRLKMNPSLAYRILGRLYKSQFLVKKRIGKEVQYSLNKNRDYDIIVRLLEEYHLEKKELKNFINLLTSNRELVSSSYRIFVFGSHVTGDYTKKSDIDILFVNKDRKLVGKACREMSVVLGKNINPLIYTRKKFKSDLSKNEPMLASIVNNVRNRVVVK
jgi:predicted nucleotidyltransferase